MKILTDIQKRQRQLKVINAVMQLMVEEAFSVGEAEELPEALSEELRRNSERFEKEKPFAIYKKD